MSKEIKIDKAWSIRHEGHLNKNNIIFNDKIKRLVQGLEEVNNNLGHYVLKEVQMSKGYEQFKKVDAELDKLLLYIEKLEEDYARIKFLSSKRTKYKEAYEIFHDYFDELPEDIKIEIDKELRKLDL